MLKTGSVFGFVLNMNSLVQEKPSDYSVEAAQDIAEKYEEKFANDDSGKKKAVFKLLMGQSQMLSAL